MTRDRLLTIALALLAAVALLAVAGCSGNAASSSSAAGSTPATPPTLKLVQPAEGAEVPAGELKVAVETTGLKFVMPSNKAVAGEGHVHFTLDGEPDQMSAEPEYTFKDVKPGAHKLKAQLVQNDTKPFDPPVEQEISFSAK